MTGFIDRRQVRRGFARAASTYGQADFLVREIDVRMQERLDVVRIDPRRILDLGCSRGGSRAGLTARYPAADWIGLDLVPEMLAGQVSKPSGWERWLPFAQRGRGVLPVAGDAGALPFPANMAGLAWSNLLLHWLDNPLPMLAEVHRVLETGGLFMFSTFGPDTFKELRAACGDGYVHTQRFADMHDLGDMLVASGFADPVVDMEMITLTYESLEDMVRDIRGAGGTCAMQDRRRGLAGRSWRKELAQGYETFRRDGRLPATFEVVYGHAWKAAPKKTADGRSVIRFDRPGKN